MDKAQWAEGKARELCDQAHALRRQGFGGSYSRAARRGEVVRRLEAQAWRLESLARRLRPEDLEGLPF